MLRDAFFLARKDLAHMFRARETWLWTFIMPVVFFYFFGTVTGGFGRPRGAKPAIAVSVPADAGFLAGHLLRRLEERDYQVVRVRSAEELAKYRRRLTVPPGFTAAVLVGTQVKVGLTCSGEGLDAEYDQVRVARAVYTVLADLLVVSRDHDSPGAEDFAKWAAAPRTVTLEVRSAGVRRRPPTGFEQAVPGSMVMFTLLVLFVTGGVMLTIERRQGLLRRLASAPVSRGAVALGKWSARMSLGVIQIGFAMLAGTVLFKVHWGPNLPALALVLLAYGGLAASLGIVLGNVARTEGQVVALGVVATNVLAAVGGCWWPIEITPEWVQKLALAVPSGWAMDAVHQLVTFGSPPAAVMPHLALMSVAALLAGWAAARTLRFQ